jgi:C4-dicarboxylate-binding protein DctP
MTANRPLHMPEDFKGLKIRVQSSKVLEQQFRVLGATPQVLAFSEVYQALATGVVDGIELPPSNVYTQRVHEVQKYTILSNHGYTAYGVIVNKKFWDGLPADIRAALEKAMAEATKYTNEIAQAENDDALAEIRKSGKTTVTTLTPAEQAAWRKALEPLYTEMASRIGKATIDEFIKEANGATN